jgi:hypothetical protein
MNLRTHLPAIGTVLALLFAGAAPAQAAKAVKKKNAAATEHHHHGKVIAVDHKSGFITIQEHHKSKKKINNRNVTHTHKFSVNNASRFFVAHNKQRRATNFAAVHKGEHVSVAAHNHHADSVVIHTKAAKAAKKNNRKFTNATKRVGNLAQRVRR